MKLVVAALVGSVALALPSAAPVDRAAAFLAARQQADGGFAEPGQRSTPALTAWVALGLAAAGRHPDRAADYLAGKPTADATDLALRALALRALGRAADDEIGRLERLRRPDGRIGTLVNSTVWGILALRAAGRPAGAKTVRYLRRQQARSGGWSWAPRGAPDTNDTAVAVEALRAAGVPAGDTAVRRGLSYLRRLRNRDGGSPLVRGRASDAQSTAWVLQAFAAAGRRLPTRARAYLLRLQRPDGSFRYSARYAVTPAWVTAQVVPALAGRPFPLR
jgi:iron complex transport system substrate-binding protein